MTVHLDIRLPRSHESYPKTRQILRFYSMLNPERFSRRELLSALENRKIQLVGGQWVQGYNGSDRKAFTKRHLLELLEGSRSLTETDRARLKIGLPYLTSS